MTTVDGRGEKKLAPRPMKEQQDDHCCLEMAEHYEKYSPERVNKVHAEIMEEGDDQEMVDGKNQRGVDKDGAKGDYG